jgi:arylsulfatase A-like enzyme
MDVGPAITDLCGLGPRSGLAGVSLRPLLPNPQARWDRPSVTTYLCGNHSARDKRWRYIRYRDATEELYDRDHDPIEWTNLALDPGHEKIKQRLSRWLPATNAPDSVKQTGRAREDG